MHSPGRRTTIVACALTVSVALAACSSGPEKAGNSAASSTTVARSVDATTTTAPTTGAVTWTNCGDIECGVLRVPSTHRDPASRRISVGVYSRKAVRDRVGTVVLLPDYDGPTARDLVTTPNVYLGSAARRFDVLAVSPRGFFDSTPLPCTLTSPYIAPNEDAFAVSASCRSNEQLNTVSYGVTESVQDLEMFVGELSVGPVTVVGWGRGATIAAAWKLMHPASIGSMVLDSPDDPGVPVSQVAAKNRVAEDAGVNNVMQWCTAHLSCPLFENAAKRVKLIINRIEEGRVNAGATMGSLRMAFLNTIVSADYGALFRALSVAESGDHTALVALAGADAPGAATRVAARIAGTCGDLSAADAEQIISDDAAFEETVIRVGSGDTIARVCAGMPEPVEPLGSVRAADGARGSRVQVFVSATDGVASPAMVKAFAQRAAWKFRAVKSDGHLVVGHDRTTTQWVSNFLLGS